MQTEKQIKSKDEKIRKDKDISASEKQIPLTIVLILQQDEKSLLSMLS